MVWLVQLMVSMASVSSIISVSTVVGKTTSEPASVSVKSPRSSEAREVVVSVEGGVVNWDGYRDWDGYRPVDGYGERHVAMDDDRDSYGHWDRLRYRDVSRYRNWNRDRERRVALVEGTGAVATIGSPVNPVTSMTPETSGVVNPPFCLLLRSQRVAS